MPRYNFTWRLDAYNSESIVFKLVNDISYLKYRDIAHYFSA